MPGHAAAGPASGIARPRPPAPRRFACRWRTGAVVRTRADATTPISGLLAPGVAVARDQRAGRRRSPGAGRVRPRRLAALLPFLLDRLEPPPGGVQFVAPHEQRQFAVNDVHDEPLVRVPLARLVRLG